MTLIWQPRTMAVVLMAGIALTGCGGKKKADGVKPPVSIAYFDTLTPDSTTGAGIALYWRAEYADSCSGNCQPAERWRRPRHAADHTGQRHLHADLPPGRADQQQHRDRDRAPG